MNKAELRRNILKYSKRFNKDTIILEIDGFVRTTFKQRSVNKFTNNYIKATVLNEFYSTNVLAIEKIAHHIARKTNFDAMIENGSLKAVDSIRVGHGIKRSKGGKEIDFYSFATKYCCLHNPSAYPIYDKYVFQLLQELNGHFKWLDEINDLTLRNYKKHAEVINKCMLSAGINGWDYKKVDEALWTWAKEKYD